MAKDEQDPLLVYAQWLEDGDIPEAKFEIMPDEPSDDEFDSVDSDEEREHDEDDQSHAHAPMPEREPDAIPTRHPSEHAEPKPDIFQSSPVVPEVATKSETRVQSDVAPSSEASPTESALAPSEPRTQAQSETQAETPASAEPADVDPFSEPVSRTEPVRASALSSAAPATDAVPSRTFTEERMSAPRKSRRRPKVSTGAFASASVKSVIGDDNVDPFADFSATDGMEVDSSVYKTPEFEMQLIYTVREAARVARMRDVSCQTVAKKSQGNFVTEVDIAIENFLKEQLAKLLPGAGFITEESKPEVARGCNWIIDPIDGTTNYLNGLSYVISIALVAEGKTELGLVYSCTDDKVFYAQRGCGAFVDDGPGRNRIHVSEWHEDEGLLFFGCPYNRKKGPAIFARASRLYPYYSDVKRIGPAALDICMVAQGSAKLYMEFDLKLWDVAAGMLILKEAGGSYDVTTDNMLLFGTEKSIAQAVEKLDLTLKSF